MPNPTHSDSTAESGLKRDLVLACHILAAHGQGDAIWGHVSARLPGWDRLWMKPHAMGIEEVQQDDLILIDFDGKVLAGDRPRHTEYPIHSEIMRARPEGARSLLRGHLPRAGRRAAAPGPADGRSALSPHRSR